MTESVIESCEYYDYRPPISETFNDISVEFPIIVYEDIVTQPSKSLLVISGQVIVTNNADNEVVRDFDANDVHWMNNGILRLFDKIDYFLGDNKIDSIRKPGISCTMKGLCCYESDELLSNTGWRVQKAECDEWSRLLFSFNSLINGNGVL